MARLYGGRWRILDGPQLGQGGQGHVFRVVDNSGSLKGEFALKRVINPNRHLRFQSELEAVSRLHHPHIVRLIDHSALTDEKLDVEKQFLVMPIARGGDLSNKERVSLYKDSIDNVIQIGKQICSALEMSHGLRIIHRDIKPQNILFADFGHELWVADFGICLIQDQPRITETGEAVGPRAFMAPELEAGGQLEVDPSADIYSLGKVLYFALTGGVVLPREELLTDQYSQVFERGERHRILKLLLSRMICRKDHGRIRDIKQVIQHLASIEEWDKSAMTLPVSKEGLAIVVRLQNKVIAEQRRISEIADEQDRQAALLAGVESAFLSWLEAELKKMAAQINSYAIFQSDIQNLSLEPNEVWRPTWTHGNAYTCLNGLELRLDRHEAGSIRRDLLQVRLCRHSKVTVTVTLPGQPTPPVPEIELAMVPGYKRITVHPDRPRSGIVASAFFANSDAVGNERLTAPHQSGPNHGLPPASHTIAWVTRSFDPNVNQHERFRMEDWPAVIERLQGRLSAAINAFFLFLESDNRTSP